MSKMTKTNVGYGLGSMIRVGENLIAFYLVFYLTTLAGVTPAIAGAISGTGLLIGALVGPVVGFLSDRTRSKYGRRRPFMIATIAPAMVLLTLLFTKVDFGDATTIYYFVIVIMFTVCYYSFIVPYETLGTSLTSDYNERTLIRSICTAVLYVSVLIGGTFVLQIQGVLASSLSQETAWTIAVLLTCSLPGFIFGYLSWRVTRGKEIIRKLEAEEPTPPQDLLSTLKIFTLRPVWVILVWALIYFSANTIVGGTTIYLGVFVLGLPEAVAATYFTIATATTLLTLVPANYLSRRVGKRNAILVGIAVFVVAAIVMAGNGFDNYLSGAILVVAFNICNAIVLACSFAMIYDLRELTELKLGDDKSAAIVGWFGLAAGSAGAVGAFVIGNVLQAVDFDPTAPTAAVDTAIVMLQTLVPAGMLVVSALVLLLWNHNAKAHASVTEQIAHIAEAERPKP